LNFDAPLETIQESHDSTSDGSEAVEDVQAQHQASQEALDSHGKVYGYSLSCDNLNRNFHVHDAYSGSRAKKIDCVSVECLFNRVGIEKDMFVSASRVAKAIDLDQSNFFIGSEDVIIMKNEMFIIITRILAKSMRMFSGLKKKLFGILTMNTLRNLEKK